MSTGSNIVFLGIFLFLLALFLGTSPRLASLAGLLFLLGLFAILIGGSILIGGKKPKNVQTKVSALCEYLVGKKCTGTPNLTELRGTECKNSDKEACCKLCDHKNNCIVSCEFASSTLPEAKDTQAQQTPSFLEPKSPATAKSEVAELKKQLAEQERELDSTYKAYELLETRVNELEEELKQKDAIILKLEKQLEKQKLEKEKGKTRKPRLKSRQKKAPIVRKLTFDIDLAVYDYILAHGGTIRLTSASRDLGITVGELRQAIQRLKKEGKLAET